MDSSGNPSSIVRQKIFKPQMFGRYCLIDQISKGGMSDIYLAKISAVGGFSKPVVIKKLQTQYSSKPRYVKRFINEANTLARLNHSNIVQVVDMGIINGEYFIAMEYIEGRNAAHILLKAAKTGRIPSLEFIVHVIWELARGLAYSHRRKSPDGESLLLVHQDINSFNVMVSYEADVRIIDFGIAQIFLDKNNHEDLPVTGKLLYFSPEQLLKKPLDRRVDIYGTGALLYEFLTGQRLVQHQDTIEDTVRTILELNINEIIQSNEKIQPELKPILIRSLAFSPSDRYSWMEDMIEDLRAVVKNLHLDLNAREFSSYMREIFHREVLLDRRRMRKLLATELPGTPSAPGSRQATSARARASAPEDKGLASLSASVWPFDETGRCTVPKMGVEARTVCFRAGSLVFSHGDVGGEVYVVQKGRVRLFVGSGHSTQTLRILQEGDFFGEASLLDETRRAVSARAEDDCQLLCLEKEIFFKVMRGDLTRRIVVNLVERLTDATSLLEAGLLDDTLSRVIYGLSFMLRRSPRRDGMGIDLDELRDQFGFGDTPLVKKYLQKLEALDVIEQRRNTVLVRDVEKLQNLFNILAGRGRFLLKV